VERQQFVPGLLLVGRKVAETDEFVEDEGQGEGVADRTEKPGLPADGDGEKSGGEKRVKRRAVNIRRGL
jgi:hypothetical protein